MKAMIYSRYNKSEEEDDDEEDKVEVNDHKTDTEESAEFESDDANLRMASAHERNENNFTRANC